MNYKSIEELLASKSAYENNRNKIYEKKEESKSKLKTSKGSIKKHLKEQLRMYNEHLRIMDHNIDELNQAIMKSIIFPQELLMPFVLKCINFYEDEEYILKNICINGSFIFNETYIPNFRSYNMIFPKTLEDDVNNLENMLLKTFEAFDNFFVEKECNYYMGYTSYENSLILNGKLNENFKHFHYMEEVAYRLANRRIAEPYKTIDKILDEEYESIIIREKKLGKKNL